MDEQEREDVEPEDVEGAEAAEPAGSDVSAEDADDDPRPVFQGDWKAASARERGLHGAAVQAWKRRHPEAADGDGSRHADERVAAILGSHKGSAPLDSEALRVLRSIMHDTAAPASARVTAANAVESADSAARRTAAEVERDRVTAALGTAPLHDRLLLLERIVRRDEEPGWRSVFDSEGAEPADPADPADSADSADSAADDSSPS